WRCGHPQLRRCASRFPGFLDIVVVDIGIGTNGVSAGYGPDITERGLPVGVRRSRSTRAVRAWHGEAYRYTRHRSAARILYGRCHTVLRSDRVGRGERAER